MRHTIVIVAGALLASAATPSARAETAEPSVERCRDICSAALRKQLTADEKAILTQCTNSKRCSLAAPIDEIVRNPLIRLTPR